MDKIINHLRNNIIPLESINKICVYSLWNDNEIVYVGKTNNINRRLSQHEGLKEFDSFSYFILENEFIADITERKLIFELKPIYNKTKEKEYINISSLRTKIRSLSEHHKYNEKFYIMNLKKEIERLKLRTKVIDSTLHLELYEALKLKDYIFN